MGFWDFVNEHPLYSLLALFVVVWGIVSTVSALRGNTDEDKTKDET